MPGIIPAFRGKGRFLGLLFCLFGGLTCLYGRGKADTAETEPQNKEWILCVTAFDVSSLPPARRLTGEIIMRNLINSLNLVEQRRRVSREYAYYEEYAAFRSRGEAAKRLAAKRNERDQLIYRGDPEWRYQRNLRAIDADIKKLEEEFFRAREDMPLIEAGPVFKLSEGGNNGVFPAPPRSGDEYRFCTAQRADAFLTGMVSEFHGRVFISIRMYTVYTRSFLYEDSIIFSTDDMTAAVDELAGRLVAAVSGTAPAAVAVNAGPEDATVTINGAFAGRGTVRPQERPPGTVEVEVFAAGHETVSLPVTINPGEVAELYINLQPVSREALVVDVPGEPGALVYQGALYLGTAPYTFAMPVNGYEYFHVETGEGKTGMMIVQGAGKSAETPPVFAVEAKKPHGPGEKPVEESRQRFYGAYGRFWVVLPVAFILNGLYSIHLETYKLRANEALFDDTMRFYYFSTGASVLAGAALAETFYRLFRYIYTSGENTTPPMVR